MFWNEWHRLTPAVARMVALLEGAGAREVSIFGSAIELGRRRGDIDVAVLADDVEAVERALSCSIDMTTRVSRDRYGGSSPLYTPDAFDVVVLTSLDAANDFHKELAARGGRLLPVSVSKRGHLLIKNRRGDRAGRAWCPGPSSFG